MLNKDECSSNWHTPYKVVPHWSKIGILFGLYSIKFENTYILNVTSDQAYRIAHCLNAAYNLGRSSVHATMSV